MDYMEKIAADFAAVEKDVNHVENKGYLAAKLISCPAGHVVGYVEVTFPTYLDANMVTARLVCSMCSDLFTAVLT